jgi:transposase
MSVMENVTINSKEKRRGLVIAQTDRGEISVAEGARLLAVSVRHGRRVRAAYRERGVAALAHGNRGAVPSNAVDKETRQAVIALATGKYVGFNQVHLTEQLGAHEGIVLSRSSVRRILEEAGIGSPRTRRAPAHRSRRARYPRAGMLVQIDASPHNWKDVAHD